MTDPASPRIRITQQSDGRWIWTREDGSDGAPKEVNLGWTGATRAIVGSHAARLKRPLIEVIAAAIRREYGTDVIVTTKEGVEP